LNGDGNNYGLIEISEEFGLTKPGKLANYYIGVIYMKQGKFNDAIEAFKDFSASDLLVQARAYSLIGDCYMELGRFEDADEYYSKAADYKENKYFTPTYLMKAALAQEKANDLQEAIKTYNKIIEEYSDSQEYNDARKHKARVEALASK
jgi:tetratricopeptide (TPR) repeat protein